MVLTFWSGPAFAMGAWLLTVMTTSSGAEASPRLSVTVRVKVSTAGSPGAVKVGCTAVGSLRATAGPPAWVQR